MLNDFYFKHVVKAFYQNFASFSRADQGILAKLGQILPECHNSIQFY